MCVTARATAASTTPQTISKRLCQTRRSQEGAALCWIRSATKAEWCCSCTSVPSTSVPARRARDQELRRARSSPREEGGSRAPVPVLSARVSKVNQCFFVPHSFAILLYRHLASLGRVPILFTRRVGRFTMCTTGLHKLLALACCLLPCHGCVDDEAEKLWVPWNEQVSLHPGCLRRRRRYCGRREGGGFGSRPVLEGDRGRGRRGRGRRGRGRRGRGRSGRGRSGRGRGGRGRSG